MNKREVKQEGRRVGAVYVSWVDIHDAVDVYLQGTKIDGEIYYHPVDIMVTEALLAEANGRQYSGDFSYEIAREDNADELFDAYDEGIYLGALKEARRRFKQYFTPSEQKKITKNNIKQHLGV